jgi:hypothetical protein
MLTQIVASINRLNDLTVTGGTAPVTLCWSNDCNDAGSDGNTPGTYNVTVTDANGCTQTLKYPDHNALNGCIKLKRMSMQTVMEHLDRVY